MNIEGISANLSQKLACGANASITLRLLRLFTLPINARGTSVKYRKNKILCIKRFCSMHKKNNYTTINGKEKKKH